MRKGFQGISILILTVFVVSCGQGSGGSIAQEFDLSAPQRTAQFTVGSKEFTEQEILGYVMIKALEAAGADVNNRIGLGDTEAIRQAQITGTIDMYWEYTGTGWLVHLSNPNPIPDPQEQYEAVADKDLKENNIEWLEPAPANNTYTIATSQATAERLDVDEISDLERLVEENPEEATLCTGLEFYNRSDGLPGLEEAYGIEFEDDNVSVMSDNDVYGAVDQDGRCNFGSVFRTDGRIQEFGLRLLEDDQDFFATYNPAPVVRQEVLEEYPRLEELYAPISEKLDTGTLRELSAAVEIEGDTPENVAEGWLRENGFIE